MSVPKRQHWVPRFYLRYFKVADSQKERVWIFNREEGDPVLTAIEKIAAENYLYSPKLSDGSRDFRLEQKLANYESFIARLWPSLANGFLDFGAKGIRQAIALYLAIQFLRHPERRESCRKTHEKLLDVIGQEPKDVHGRPDIESITIGGETIPFNHEEWEQMNGDDYVEKTWLALIEDQATEMANLLMRKRWSMVCVDRPQFVTSDYPFFVATPDHERYQLGGDGAIILFPICPCRILSFDDLDAPQNQYYRLTWEQAEIYNYLTWVNTEQFMISPRPIRDVLIGMHVVMQQYERDLLA